jgi:hypothetical protein
MENCCYRRGHHDFWVEGKEAYGNADAAILIAFPSWINGCQARRTYLGLTCKAKATYPVSRAFVKEQDGDAVEELPDRPISEHPNDVTPEGAVIDADPRSAGYLLRRAADR